MINGMVCSLVGAGTVKIVPAKAGGLSWAGDNEIYYELNLFVLYCIQL